MTYAYDASKLGKVAYDIYIKCLETASDWGTISTWYKVGICAEKPSLTTPQGDTYKVNTGDEPVISKNIQFEATVAAVTAANYLALNALINKLCSVAFVPKGGSAPSGDTAPIKGIIAKELMLYPELNFISNDQNIFKLSGKKETPAYESTPSIVLGAES